MSATGRIVRHKEQCTPAVVDETLVSPSFGSLLLLLLIDLGGLRLDFTRTSERSVDWVVREL